MNPTQGEDPIVASARRITRAIWLSTIAAFIITAIIGMTVVLQVPLDTTVRYNRVSRSFDVPLLVFAFIPLILASLAIKNRHPETKALPKWERLFLVYFGTFYLLASITGQIVFAVYFYGAANLS
ncbi:hypothetical protein [Frigoribacterium salinisoli]